MLRRRKRGSSRSKEIVVLIHQKGDTTEVSNYRPITLLSSWYKVFSKVIPQRLDSQINQPREQVEFRKGYSTFDHLHVVNQLQEKLTNISFHYTWLLFTTKKHLIA